jgi:hypothetical protein
MKWVTLLKDFKEKVGLTQSSPTSTSSSSAPPPSSPSSSSRDHNAFSASITSSSPSRFVSFFFLY